MHKKQRLGHDYYILFQREKVVGVNFQINIVVTTYELILKNTPGNTVIQIK